MIKRVEKIGIEATSLVLVVPGRLFVDGVRLAKRGDCVVVKATAVEVVVIAAAVVKAEGMEAC